MKGPEVRKWWSEEEKSMNQSIQNYVMELACLQAMAWPIPGDHGDAVWKVSQHQPKWGESSQQFSIATHTTGQRFSPWTSTLPVHEYQGHYCGGTTHKITQVPEDESKEHKVDLRWVMVGTPVGTGWHGTELHIAGIGTGEAQTSEVIHKRCVIHTLPRKDNFSPFSIFLGDTPVSLNLVGNAFMKFGPSR